MLRFGSTNRLFRRSAFYRGFARCGLDGRCRFFGLLICVNGFFDRALHCLFRFDRLGRRFLRCGLFRSRLFRNRFLRFSFCGGFRCSLLNSRAASRLLCRRGLLCGFLCRLLLLCLFLQERNRFRVILQESKERHTTAAHVRGFLKLALQQLNGGADGEFLENGSHLFFNIGFCRRRCGNCRIGLGCGHIHGLDGSGAFGGRRLVNIHCLDRRFTFGPHRCPFVIERLAAFCHASFAKPFKKTSDLLQNHLYLLGLQDLPSIHVKSTRTFL